MTARGLTPLRGRAGRGFGIKGGGGVELARKGVHKDGKVEHRYCGCCRPPLVEPELSA